MPEKVVDLIIDLYKKTQAPTILFDKKLEYIWSNETAHTKFPFLKTNNGINILITEKERMKILSYLTSKNEKNNSEHVKDKNASYSHSISSPYAPPCTLTYTVFNADDGTELYLCVISNDNHHSTLSNLRLEDLLSVVSYHMREPLFYIFSSLDSLEILFDDELSAYHERKQSAIAYINSISENSYSILRVITMLNKYLKIINGIGTDSKKEIFQLNNYIDTLAHAIHVSTSGGEIPFYYHVSGESMVVEVDPEEISTIVLNLISNAFLYTKEGNTVSLTLKREGNYAVIKVIDKGAGIEEDRLKDIFVPFNNLAFPLQKTGGIGLGLAVSKLSALGFDGDIEIRSELDKGTIVELKIPLASSIKTKVITLNQGDISFISNKFSNIYIELPGIAKKPDGD